ncbi:MAG: cyclic nucleotide-binding domain-containing protein, partial [Actinobacteria bacterium]|nr:cyclic nucleotide-binding domain-containing protein [Actinomycetota bacterium]
MLTQTFPQLLRWALASFSMVIGVMSLLALGLVGGYALGLTLALAAVMVAIVGVIGAGAMGASWSAIRVTQLARARWPVGRMARAPAGRERRGARAPGPGMSLNEKAEALGRADIFLGLPSPELEHVAFYAEERHAPAGAMLAVERQQGQDIYFILRGQVQLFTRSGLGEITVRVA